MAQRSRISSLAKVLIQIHAKSPNARIKVRGNDGSFIEIDDRELGRVLSHPLKTKSTAKAHTFTEAHSYLKNAGERLNADTDVGYADCKANCRNALVSALKQLTGKENIMDAVKELGKLGVLGGNEQEFVESYGDFLKKMYNLASKQGPHPPLPTDRKEAELVLNVTTDIIKYLAS